jgi:hypothetical protein
MPNNAKVLIVGAGSMGLATGYYLKRSGAEVTFLVRPHRVADLRRPHILYSYDDDSLKEFSGYSVIDAPDKIADVAYDYIVITLDGAALRAPAGVKVVEAIGEAALGNGTGIILGTIGHGLREWFLAVSGLPAEQVINGALGIQCYPVAAVTLPLHPPTDPSLLAKAELAYRHCWPFGFVVDDSAPGVAQGFAEIYSANGESLCIVQPAPEFAAGITPTFAIMAAWELMEWPRADLIDPNSPEWQLGCEAAQEIQSLDIHGDVGRRLAKETTPEGLTERWRVWQADMLPLDLTEFNRYHHGGKVNGQDRLILRDCVAEGEAEGRPMTALRSLLASLPA